MKHKDIYSVWTCDRSGIKKEIVIDANSITEAYTAVFNTLDYVALVYDAVLVYKDKPN